jgi:hypothetical protein
LWLHKSELLKGIPMTSQPPKKKVVHFKCIKLLRNFLFDVLRVAQYDVLRVAQYDVLRVARYDVLRVAQ